MLAELSGYSPQRIGQWRKMGMDHVPGSGAGGKGWLYPRAAALKWIKGNATGIPGAHGGKRSRAGRAKAGTEEVRPASAQGSAPGLGERQSARPHGLKVNPEKQGGGVSPLPPLKPRSSVPSRRLEAASFVPPGGPGGPQPAEDEPKEKPYIPPTPAALRLLTPVEVKMHLDIEKILTERLGRAEKERMLLSVEAAKREWSDACTAIARGLAQQRDTMSSAIVAEAGFPVDRMPRLRLIIERGMREIVKMMRTSSFGPDEDPEIPAVIVEDDEHPPSASARRPAKRRTHAR